MPWLCTPYKNVHQAGAAEDNEPQKKYAEKENTCIQKEIDYVVSFPEYIHAFISN
jgi:hypothetical protein